ncbi:MAG TPA: hypothetical protein VJ103_01470 [Candidatus Paceibacterota bacterium]|nr:hypothetical protein [Candidatus Paceibacterota bacterium]
MRLGPEKFEITPGESVAMSLRRELLGAAKNVEEIEKEREIVAEIAAKAKTSLFNAALIREKERKSGNPTNPNSPFANFARLRIAEGLDLPDDEVLKFYSSVSGSKNQTVLERDFKVNAFLELEREEDALIVPISLTTRSEENPYALVYDLPKDFPIHGRFEKNEFIGLLPSEEKLFRDAVQDLANQISRRFKHLIEIEKSKKEK